MIQKRVNQIYDINDKLALINHKVSDQGNPVMLCMDEALSSTIFTLDTQNIKKDNFSRANIEDESLCYHCYYYLTNFNVNSETKYQIFDSSTFRIDVIDRFINLRLLDYLEEQINLSEYELVSNYFDVWYEEMIFKSIQKDISQDNIEEARQQINSTIEYLPHSNRLNKLKKLLEPPRVISSSLSASKNRDKERDWLKKNSKKFKGKWVALVDDKLIAFNKSISVVIRKTKKKYDLKEVLLHFIPR